jgi:hypothetical protein
MTTLSPLITPEQAELLQLVYRYRLVTWAVLEVFLDRAAGALEADVAQLETLGLLEQCTTGSLRYWELSALARREIFHDRYVRGRLSPEALYGAYAFLLFAAYRGAERLTRQEFSCEFAWSRGTPAPGAHYLALDGNDGPPILGLLYVEEGPAQLPDRIARRVQELVRRHEKHSGFRKLIRSGRFEVAVALSTIPRQEALLLALSRRPPLPLCPLVVALPELIEVSAAGSHSAAAKKGGD